MHLSRHYYFGLGCPIFPSSMISVFREKCLQLLLAQVRTHVHVPGSPGTGSTSAIFSRSPRHFSLLKCLSDPQRTHARTDAMDEALVGRLEAAVSRLEALNGAAGATARGGYGGQVDHASAHDPAILAFDELVAGAVGRVSAAAGKIGAEVAEVTRVLEKAFLVGKDLLVRTKQTQV